MVKKQIILNDDALFNKEVLKCINSAQKGDAFPFTNIKCKSNADDLVRNLGSLAFVTS
jgi:hypothetical protein